MSPRVRIGIINLMPQAERYEQLLLGALTRGMAYLGADAAQLEPVWIRLASHGYASTDLAHLTAHYRAHDEASRGGLDGLVLTGAPVEHLAFEEVRYWSELCQILERSRALPTLGLCWGAMALARVLGIDKCTYAEKLFGLYDLTPSPAPRTHPLAEPAALTGVAQSRHAGLDEASLARAVRAGVVRPLAQGAEGGCSILESDEGRWLMHVGHPEYTVERIVFEYERDRACGRSDVSAPRGLDLTQPDALRVASEVVFAHGAHFFAGWLSQLVRAR